MIAMWCILDKFILCHTPFLIILFFFYFRYKLYNSLQKIPCELLEFSLSTRHLFFCSCSFQFFENLVRTHTVCQQLLKHCFGFSLLCFFSGLSICLCLLFASRDATSFSAFFKADFFSFNVFFCSSIAFWMNAISVVKFTTCSFFSAIWDT